MMTEDILKRIDELIGLGNALLATKTPGYLDGSYDVDAGRFRAFRSASLSFLERFFGASPYTSVIWVYMSRHG